MEFRRFERDFLRLAFTTDVALTPASVAFVMGVSVAESEEHLNRLVSQGTLELSSDDDGRLYYAMPERPEAPMRLDHPALIGHHLVTTECFADPHMLAHGASQAIVVRRMGAFAIEDDRPTSGQAVVSMFLNAMVCPGVGSLVSGRTSTGLAQLSLFLVGLPLAVIKIGLPIMLAAWVWGMVTGAQLVAEARD